MQKTVLVIDDSTTIRRLVDSHLATVGYTVVLAATAEEGLQLANEVRPDVILLDHQLPGTTGCEVGKALLENPDLCNIPVVASSTLRKRAYIEYADLSNVIDMLPKPYSTELLETTVANALETGRLIVESQSQGTAVPEVIEAQHDASLSGGFDIFTPRELIDFLNNGEKQGMLEIVLSRSRVWVFVSEGRIQAVTATGIQPADVTATLPESLRDVAPVFKMTLDAHRGQGAEGLVELLNNKVLDPRLLRKLLRHQAAVLLTHVFTEKPAEFRFHACQSAPELCQSLPLDASLVALLVDGMLYCDSDKLPEVTADSRFVRSSKRGQNVDRSGLAASYMRVLSCLAQPVSIGDVRKRMDWDEETTRRVLHGIVLADLAEMQVRSSKQTVFVFESDAEVASQLRNHLVQSTVPRTGKVVRDLLALKLLVRRERFDVVVFSARDKDHVAALAELRRIAPEGTHWVVLTTDELATQVAEFANATVALPLDTELFEAALSATGQTSQPCAVSTT